MKETERAERREPRVPSESSSSFEFLWFVMVLSFI